MKRILRDFPCSSPMGHFEAMQGAYGVGNQRTLGHINIRGKRVVYMLEQVEGEEVVLLSDETFGRVNSHNVEILGYSVNPTGWLKKFKSSKIEEIPIDCRNDVEIAVKEKLEGMLSETFSKPIEVRTYFGL